MYRLIPFLLAAALALPAFAAFADLPDRDAALRGVEYIRTTQQPDGGFGGFGDGQTYDAILAIRSAGLDPNTFEKEGKTPADFLLAKASAASTPGIAAKAALAAVALNLDPTDVGGVDLIAVITGAYDDTTGLYAEDAFNQSLSLLGLACTENEVAEGSINGLLESQIDDGGWGFEGASDADTTALAVMALLAAGLPATDEGVADALSYFQATQGNDGGWGFDPDQSNANSTAVVVQALLAAGLEADAYAKDGMTPSDFFAATQLPDGSFPGFDPAFATNQAIPALAGRTFCDMASTEIEQLPPSPTPTSTPTALPPTATPAAMPATVTATATTAITPTATTAAPQPPNAGAGTAGRDGSGAAPWLLLGFILAASGAATAVVARSRRP